MLVFLAVVLFSQIRKVPGQTAERGSAIPAEEAAKRLLWLKSVESNIVPQPTPASLKKRFAETRVPAVRFNESASSVGASALGKAPGENSTTGPISKITRIAETHAAEALARVTPSPETKVPGAHTAAISSIAGRASGKSADTPAPKTSPAATHAENVAGAKRTPEPRIAEVHPLDTPAPKPSPAATHAENVAGAKRTPEPRIAEVHPLDTPAPKPSPAAMHSENVAGAKRTPEPRIAEVHPSDTPAPKPSPTATHAENVAGAKRTPEPRVAEVHPSDTPAPKPSPAATHAENVANAKRTPEPRIAEVHPSGTPAPRPSPPATHAENMANAKRTPEPRIAEVHPSDTPAPRPSPPAMHAENVASAKRTPEPRLAEVHPSDTPTPKPHLAATHAEIMGSRYPWKTGIVTTVFWIGEPVGGNNFTPNYSSSWDANWSRNYGGYDNPKPEARRNFTPVNFTPRQNPFYVALPYNDVTRGTTKPEARLVIPWFKEAFRREGQSVCRDRWVAIRNRAGRVGYAQWSDCGPFRTDHWQYVFGMEKPKPNLNEGAGLDVSPALRDYLGLQSTDVTDWKFVEAKDVPSGPWLLYGENNPFAQRRPRVTSAPTKPDSPAEIELAVIRTHSL